MLKGNVKLRLNKSRKEKYKKTSKQAVLSITRWIGCWIKKDFHSFLYCCSSQTIRVVTRTIVVVFHSLIDPESSQGMQEGRRKHWTPCWSQDRITEARETQWNVYICKSVGILVRPPINHERCKKVNEASKLLELKDRNACCINCINVYIGFLSSGRC
jgi:hypothetical protein